MFNPINAVKRGFSDGEVKATQIGVDLVKRALYRDNKDAYKHYGMFSENYGGITYEEHNKAFDEAIKESAYKRSGVPTDNNFKLAFSMQNYQRAFFSVVEEVIDNVNSANEIEDILTFADVQSIAEGDSMNVEVKPTNAYFFYKTGRGKSIGRLQKYYGTNISLTPSPAEASVGFNYAQIVAGRVDWGREIARAVRGIRSGYLQDISNTVFSTTLNPIGNKTISTGTYSETDFRTQVQLIQAQNGSTNTYIYGTNISLSPILPTDTNLRLGLGAEYMENGFLLTPFGYRAVQLPQAVKPDNATIILPNNYVVVMAADISKPVSIGISGQTRVITKDYSETAGEDYIFNVKSDWDVKLAGQGRILLYKVA